MSSKTNEPGIIGQTYEHRKSHKVGVLESRDTKCKTLMFADNNGGSFTCTYSTFRSDWRKYTGEDVIDDSNSEKSETEIESSNPLSDDNKSDDVPKKRKGRPSKSKFSREELEKAASETANIIYDELISANKDKESFVVKIGGRGGRMNCVRVKSGKHSLFELWMFGDVFEFFTSGEMWDNMKFPENFGEVSAEVYEKFTLTHKIVFNEKVLQTVIKCAVEAL